MREKIVQVEYWWCSAFFCLWLLNSIQKSLIRKPGIGGGLPFTSVRKKMNSRYLDSSSIMLPPAPLVYSKQLLHGPYSIDKVQLIYSFSVILLCSIRHFSSHPYLFGKHWFPTFHFYFISSPHGCLWELASSNCGCEVAALWQPPPWWRGTHTRSLLQLVPHGELHGCLCPQR